MPNPISELPRVADLEKEFAEHAYSNGKPSWYAAVELVKQQIAWLEYVPEHELSEAEADNVVVACRKAYTALRRLTARYID